MDYYCSTYEKNKSYQKPFLIEIKNVRRMLEDARYRQQCMLKTNLDSVIEIEDLQEKLKKSSICK